MTAYFRLCSHKRLLLTDTADGNVSVRVIAKTFASGKTEQLVYDTLASLGLPNGKVQCLHTREESCGDL